MSRKLIMNNERFKLVLDNKEIVDIYNNMGYSNVKARLSEDGFFILTNGGAWNRPNKVWKLKPNTTYTLQVKPTGNYMIPNNYLFTNGFRYLKDYSGGVVA